MVNGGVITVIINGQPRQVAELLHVSGLLHALGIPQEGTLVEKNGEALFPREFAATPVAENDRFELVRIAAGG